jgi:hypothetical protein
VRTGGSLVDNCLDIGCAPIADPGTGCVSAAAEVPAGIPESESD